MKKALLIFVLLLSAVFYSISTNYEMIAVNTSNGLVVSDNSIQEDLYNSKTGSSTVLSNVYAQEGIYQRFSTIYYGDDYKIKVNTAYPMYINDGTAIKLLSGDETLISDEFEFVDAYANLIINDGMAFNEDLTRSDPNDYILVHLSNNLYINTKDMHVKTYLNEYDIAENSILYLSTENINSSTLSQTENFVSSTIKDIDDETIITIGDQEILYSDLLLKLGETVEYHQKSIDSSIKQDEEDSFYGDSLGLGDGGAGSGDGVGTKDNEGSTGKSTSTGTNRVTATANEAAKKPEEADKTPETPQEQEKTYKIVYPEWELPTVTMGNKFKEGVYSLNVTVNVKDNANVITSGLVFEVYYDEVTLSSNLKTKRLSGDTLVDYKTRNAGTTIKIGGSKLINGVIYYTLASDSNELISSNDIKLSIVRRTTFTTSSGENIDLLITGLSPLQNYLVRAYFKCVDKYDRPYSYVDDYNVTHSQIDFLLPKAFSTKDVSNLGDVVFLQFDTTNIMGNQIQIENVGFDSSSDMDAVASLSRVQYSVSDGSQTIGSGVLSEKQFVNLLKLQTISFSYRNNIESDSNYYVTFDLFDMYGNQLNVANNTVNIKTCKKLPTTTLTASFNKDEQGKDVISQIILKNTIVNSDNVPYTDLRYIITDSDGDLYTYYNDDLKQTIDYVPCDADSTILLSDFNEGETYNVRLVATLDNGDGKGNIQRELATRSFSTSSLSTLGSLYLTVNDDSKNVCPDDRYKRIVFNIGLNAATNSQLPKYIDDLSMTLTSDSGVFVYEFTSDQIESLKNKETIVLDTDSFVSAGLSGNTQYNITFSAHHNYSATNVYEIIVNSSKKFIVTTRTPPNVLMTTPVTAPGYINTSVMIDDIDSVIVGDYVNLKIYEESDDGDKLTASYVLEKNTYTYRQILLSSDSSISSDGIAYDIKDGATYRFEFRAEEANTENGTQTDYPLSTKEVVIDTGVTGEIYLNDLSYPKGFENYVQVEYIETTGAQYIDTGLKPTLTLGVEFDIASTGRNGSERIFFGASDGVGYDVGNNYAFEFSRYNSLAVVFPQWKNGKSISLNQKYNIKFNLDGDQKYYVDDTLYQTLSYSGNLPNYNMYLGIRNCAGVANREYDFVGKIYTCKIWDYDNDGNYVLLRDYVPCYYSVTGEYGFYDLVNDEFLVDANGVGFSGPTVSTSTSNQEYFNAELNVFVKYPDNWLGNNDLYVDVYDSSISATQTIDTIKFTFDRTNSTTNKRVYNLSGSDNSTLYSDTIILTYDSTKGGYFGSFDYLVNKYDTSLYKYTFSLYTILLDNLYLSNSSVSINNQTVTQIGNNKFKSALNLSVSFPDNIGDDYSFYVDILNENYSTDIATNTLYFEYVAENSSTNSKQFNVYSGTDTKTLLDTINLTKNGSIFTGSLTNYVFNGTNDNYDDLNSYSFSIYRKKTNSSLTIPLDETSFSTEDVIYTISTIEEFFAIKTKNRKYVVVNDLVYEENVKRSRTAGKWGSSTFNAQIDFQGFSLTYKGDTALIYSLGKSGSITNLVFKTTAPLFKNSSLSIEGNNNSSAGLLTMYNYGTISNVIVEYSQVLPEDIKNDNSTVYRGTYFWSDELDYEDNAEHRYAYLNCSAALTEGNYGTIENFVVDIKTDVIFSANSGIVCLNNYGTVRNGYVYSSTNEDYKAKAYIYMTSSSTDLKNYSRFGFICASTQTSGSYVGVTESVYVLGDIYNCSGINNEGLGVVCGYNSSIVRNTFSNGNVTTNNAANKSYGPTVGYTVSAVNRNPNNNYMSTYTYDNSINLPTSTIALRSTTWLNGVLNVNYDEFNIDEMVSVGCYPQVNMNDIMPAQTLLSLPSLPSKDEVDILFSEVYEFGDPDNYELDEDLNEARSGNTLGDLITGQVGDSIYTSNSQILKVYVSDKSASQIHSLSFTDNKIVNNILLQTMDGTGVTTLYIEVYNPEQALTKYHVKGIFFKNYDGSKSSPAIQVNRDLNFTYTKLITTASDWQDVIKNPSQNHRLGGDIDFTNVDMSEIFINGTFSGTLDGNGYSLKNINVIEDANGNLSYNYKAFENIFPTGNDGSYPANVGLIKKLTGTVKNLTIENMYMEGSLHVGGLAYEADGAVVDNVFIKNSYITGASRVGGLFAKATYTDITNSGVIDTKIICVGGRKTSIDSNWKYGAAGLVCYVTNANVFERVFVNNVYIESLIQSFSNASTGGLVSVIEGNGNKFNGCYATGVINSNCKTTGGLIGFNLSNIEMNCCYSDVDVNSYYYMAGGIVGYAYASIVSDDSLLVFGDVHSQTILNSTEKCNTIKITGNSTVNAKYYKNATLLNDSEVDLSDGFDVSLLYSDEIYNYLGNYYNINVNDTEKKGILPKLVDSDGNVIANQKDTYIGGTDSEIKVTINDDNSNKIIVTVNHPSNIYINDVYTDYRYINSLVNIDNKTSNVGVNSLTKKQALAFTNVSTQRYGIQTVFTIEFDPSKDSTYLASYDYYNVYALQYTVKENQGTANETSTTDYLRINHRLSNLTQHFNHITSAADYYSDVASSVAENFIIECDIDFNDTFNSYDENNSNIVINRLIGSVSGSSYCTLSNYTMNNGDMNYNQNHGWLYSYQSSYIRCVLSEIKNIHFENFNITGYSASSVIGTLAGSGDNIKFTNCNVTVKNSAWFNGLICELQGSISNVVVDSCNVKVSGNSFHGILSGSVYCGSYGIGINNVAISNSSISGSGDFVGSIFGYGFNDYPYVKTTLNVSNITLDSVNINGNNYVGGVCGYLQSNSTYNFSNCNLTSSTIKGNYMVGGIIGQNTNNSGLTINNCYVYKSTIHGTSTSDTYVGGIVGYQPCYIHNVTVEDSIIIANGSRVGGITGFNNRNVTRTDNSFTTSSFSDDDDQDLYGYVVNCKIYGNNYVGGLVGYSDDHISRGIVTDCVIKGNKYCGGITGGNYSYSISQCIVQNTTITPWKNSSEAVYGPSYNSSQYIFGGICGDTSLITTSIVSNCFIGGENVDHVGGLQGAARFYDSANVCRDSSVQDCVVIGKNNVGGLFGTMNAYSSYKGVRYANLYSNAYVYGESNVGGIAGSVCGYETYIYVDKVKTFYNYTPMPIVENCYFTGALTSNTNAGAIYGKITGNDTEISNNFFRFVSSFPVFIKANKIGPLFCDGTSDYSYNWTNLVNDDSEIAVSLYSGTMLYFADTDGNITTETTMGNYIDNCTTAEFSSYLGNSIESYTKYSNYKDTFSNVYDNFSPEDGSVAGDAFISLYSSVDDFKNNYLQYSTINTRINKNYGSKYSFVTFRNVSSDTSQSSQYADYMPMVYTDGQTADYENFQYLIYNDVESGNIVGNRYHSIKNPFTNTYNSIYVQQGIYIPGTINYNTQCNYMSSLYNIYQQYGTATLDFDLNNYNDADYDDSYISTERVYRNLPSDYIQVEYIETSGGQYIDTGLKPTLTLGVEFDIASTGRNGSERIFFGASDGVGYDVGNNYAFEFSRYNSLAVVFPQWKNGKSISLNQKYNIKFNLDGDQKYYVDDTLYQTLSYSGDLPNYNMYLGIRNCAGVANREYDFVGKIYTCKIWDYDNDGNYVLLRDYVPCYYSVTGEYGFYDLVTKQFYHNEGSGKFVGGYELDTYGNLISRVSTDLIPEIYRNDYTQVEYIYTDGNAYIDTGIKPSLTTGVDIDISSTARSGKQRIFFGASEGVAHAYGSNFDMEFSSSNTAGALIRSGVYSRSTSEVILNAIYNYKFNMNGDLKFLLDNNLVGTLSYSGTLPDYTLYLGTRNIANSVVSDYNFVGRIYSCKIYDYDDNGNYSLLLDLVPCFKNDNNEYGFFDLVSNTFFANIGSSSFTGGLSKTEFNSTYNSTVITYSDFISIYQSEINKLNIDVLDNSFNYFEEFIGATSLTYDISVGSTQYSGNVYYKDANDNWIKDKTIDINYVPTDKINIKLTINYLDDSVAKKFDLINITDYQFTEYSTMSLYNGNIYYLFDKKLYCNTSSSPVNGNEYISIYNGKIMDASGNIYNVDTLTSTTNSNSNDYLYSFTYGSNAIKTYGNYSTIDGNLSNKYKLYVKSGNLIVIDNSTTDTGSNPIYASYSNAKSTILMLCDDGKVYSIGNTAILSKMTNFTNSDIVQISSNLNENTSNPYIGFTYKNGDVYIYNTNNKTYTFKSSALQTPKLTSMGSFGSFFRTAMSGLFSFSSNSDEELSSSSQQAESITTFLTTNGLSLGDVVGYASGSEDGVVSVANAIKSNDNSTLNITANEESDGEITLPTIDFVENESESDGTGEGTESVDDSNKFPEAEDVIDEEEKEFITDKSLDESENLITVYNGETNDFDIIDANELLNDPENVVSENSKIIDKSTLKALYNQMGESQDNTTTRGIIFYILIALAIIVIMIPVGLISKKVVRKN